VVQRTIHGDGTGFLSSSVGDDFCYAKRINFVISEVIVLKNCVHSNLFHADGCGAVGVFGMDGGKEYEGDEEEHVYKVVESLVLLLIMRRFCGMLRTLRCLGFYLVSKCRCMRLKEISREAQ
jgi:hypothetical protein